MNALLQRLQSAWRTSSAGRWYRGRDAGEQRVLALLALLAALLVLWAVLWKPVSDWRDRTDNRYQNAQSQLAWLQANEQRARAAASAQAGSGSAGRSLMPIVTRSANVLGLTLASVRPEGNGVVSVVVQSQPFNDVVKWLAALEDNNGVQVDRAAIDADEQSGLVNAQLRLN